MTDVARLAGVSNQTVSRVVNDHPYVSEDTRSRVFAAIRDLGYRPNFSARRLATNRSHSVGIVSVLTGLWGPSGIRQSLEVLVKDAGYRTVALTLTEATAQAMAASFDDLMSSGVDGILVISAGDAPADLARAQPATVPVIVLEGTLSSDRPELGLDQLAAARMATEHLLDLGHRTVAHVAGPEYGPEGRTRREGWSAALRARGLPERPLAQGDWTAASGYAAGMRLLDDDVTAVLAGNDQMAVGVLRAARERGLRVPEDLSLVGFDDVPEAEFLYPPLTTVRQDFDEVGRRVVQLLRCEIEGDEHTPPPPLSFRLEVRASTGPPPSR